MVQRKGLLFIGLLIVLASCGETPIPPTPVPSLAPSVPATAAPTVPPTMPPDTAVPPPSQGPNSALVAVDVDPALYIDNHSDPVAVLQSMYNAINRKEYVRAYSYWKAGGAEPLPAYAQFEQGYSETVSVTLSVGPVTGDAGAGNLYYAVPAVLRATKVDGTVWAFAGCYLLHLGQPANYGVPPFPPMGVQAANMQPAADSTEIAMMANQACQDSGWTGGPLGPVPTPPPGDVGAAYYIDDRSDAAAVIRSFYNAINRHEYVRAYSYWEAAAAASVLPPYPQFEQGYSTTVSVQLTLGQVTSDAGAGQLYYRVPAALVTAEAGGTTQTFVGCYTLHLSQPGIQGVPPFQQ